MFTFDTVTLLHRHGEDWAPMEEVEHHSPDDHDPERRLLRAERIYRCARCDEEVRIVTAQDET